MQQVETAVERLRSLGQSVWIDDLTREMLSSGGLVALRDRGVTGITANPTTFDKAVTSSNLYDQDIASMGGRDPAAVLWELMEQDVRQAADVLRPVYERTAGADGYVSIEVSPDIADDAGRTIAMAGELWRVCDRPNVLVKIPATSAGLPAIRHMLSEGVNINVTLTFSVRRYGEVAEAFLSGLDARLGRGLPVGHVASVASFFVSRVDSKVDALIEKRLAEVDAADDRQVGASLLGKIGIANSKLAYHRFRQVHAGPRWERLAAAGARVQRCLWASTSVKNPAYPQTMYVEGLAGRDTVNTMPPPTFHALADASIEGPALERDLELAYDQVRRLGSLGIDLEEVASELEAEGVRSFTDSYRHLIGTIEKKIRTGDRSLP